MKRNIGILLVALFLLLVIGKLGVISTIVEKKENPIYCVDTDEKKVAITFDVNWAETDYLDDILKILKDKNVKATFFVMGGWVNYSQENQEKLKRIYEGGHEIGNHSYMHPDFKKISNTRMIEEIQKTNDIVKKVVGVTPKYFRFPSGSYNSNAVVTLRNNKYTPIQWDVDSIDWKNKSEQFEYDRIIKKAKSGSIILYHNNGKYTTKSLPRVIDKLKSDGYNFVRIDDLVFKGNYYIDVDGKQKIIN
ncbi:polysaccharide deacetylase family protein [Inconstantimicrobium mannanitabidum]|uniref:Polysaccharide deacetylase family sporulation protein PdaB n=1 Tax=Inconstantimicrobium mannanitabidum TaxID=1604901 RepID=A0ACB5RA59_9CLOT|nr:polysaccharide deacetylase family protein [Clostridium sp. TW13]GKX66074.1 polysaccharide deacetylase family sporulation protein PdaB [Clostridium sp. TW13]